MGDGMTEAERLDAIAYTGETREYLTDLEKRIEWREQKLTRLDARIDQNRSGDDVAELLGLAAIQKASIATEKREAESLKTEIATMEKTL